MPIIRIAGNKTYYLEPGTTYDDDQFSFLGTNGILEGGGGSYIGEGTTLDDECSISQTVGPNAIRIASTYTNQGYGDGEIFDYGTVTVSGGVLTIESDQSNITGDNYFFNFGSIEISDGKLFLDDYDGQVYLGGPGDIKISGLGILEDYGVLDVSNLTTTGNGKVVVDLGGALTGILRVGAFHIEYAQAYKLEGVTYEGTLAIRASQAVNAYGLMLAGANGAGAGRVTVANSAELYVGDSETLDNAVLRFAGTGGIFASGGGGKNENLTLGSGFTVSQAVGANTIWIGVYSYWPNNHAGDTLFNNGVIAVTGGILTVESSAFASYDSTVTLNNAGKINVGGGELLLGVDATLENTGSLVINGTGVFEIDNTNSSVINNGVFQVVSGGALEVADAGELTLVGDITTIGGGKVEVTGTLDFSGPVNSFAGAISGSGAVLFSSGASALKAGASATVANLAESGAGTALTVATVLLSYGGAFTQGAGSKLIVNTGDALALTGTDSLSGATSGGGLLEVVGGSTTFATGATLSISNWGISGASTTATFNEGLTYFYAFSAYAGALLVLNGGALTLKGATELLNSTLSSASGRSLNLYGATSVSGLTIAGNALVSNYATATESGDTITVGDGVSTDRAELYDAAAGIWNIADDSGMARGADPASFIYNLGLFEKTAGSGTSTVAIAVTNSGRILAASGVIDFQGAITGTGADTISGPSTLAFDSSVGAGQMIAFTGSGSTLFIGALQHFAATLSGYDIGGAGGTNDAIKLLGSWTQTGFSENTTGTLGTLTLFNGTVHESLKFAGDYTSASFHVSQSGGSTVIS